MLHFSFATLLAFAGAGCDLSCKRENSAQAIHVGSLCALANRIDQLEGHLVEVRAVYYLGLRDPRCTHILVQGRTVPVVINLVSSADPDEPVSFQTDTPAWDNVDSVALSLGRERKRAEIWVTVIGYVSRKLDKSGFGHLGMYPYQVVVRTIRDVRVQHTPTFDYAAAMPPQATAR